MIFIQDNTLEIVHHKLSAIMFRPRCVNPLRAKFFSININIYLQFLSFFHTDMEQEIEILSHGRQGPTYFT